MGSSGSGKMGEEGVHVAKGPTPTRARGSEWRHYPIPPSRRPAATAAALDTGMARFPRAPLLRLGGRFWIGRLQHRFLLSLAAEKRRQKKAVLHPPDPKQNRVPSSLPSRIIL